MIREKLKERMKKKTPQNKKTTNPAKSFLNILVVEVY